MDNNLRAKRLRNYFTAVIEDKKTVQNSRDATLFIDAVCDQADRARCISRLITSRNAMRTVTSTFRVDSSTGFLNGAVSAFIQYITDDEIAQINGGQILHDLLMEVLDPPMLWNALFTAFTSHQLSSSGISAYCSLLYRSMILLPPPSIAKLRINVHDAAEAVLRPDAGILTSSSSSVRELAYKIKDALRASRSTKEASEPGAFKPGGRHDNDHADFRQIAIFPTSDELSSKNPPYYLSADAIFDVDLDNRVAQHLDNQFRLLREEMLAELREDVASARGEKPARRAPLRLSGLRFVGLHTGAPQKPSPVAIALQCSSGFPRNAPPLEDARKAFFDEHKSFLRHQAFGCLFTQHELLAFATINRDVELLAKSPPVVLLQVLGQAALGKALLALKTRAPEEVQFVVVDTPFFAFEPVLRGLQNVREMPFIEQLLGGGDRQEPGASRLGLGSLAERIEQAVGSSIKDILDLERDVVLDRSQTSSLVSGLSQSASLIQGPPGTGKSFIGALLTKALLTYTDEKILILCYTNHALDQFIEDVVDMGVDEDDIVRLGSKSSTRTEKMSLWRQTGRTRERPEAWSLRHYYSDDLEVKGDLLRADGRNLSQFHPSILDVLQSLEFSDQYDRFSKAFSVPEENNGMTMVGKRGRAVRPTYLIERWVMGKNAGIYCPTVGRLHEDVWATSPDVRRALYRQWCTTAMSERVEVLQSSIDQYTETFDRWDRCRDSRNTDLIASKRIVACTTTGAAKASRSIGAAKPGIVIIEEAGEVLESHVLTALSSHTKQLIQIGDHQQLRPKVNNYALTIEKGDGFDLNRSLFERLVVGGYTHTTLAKQHRMRPEISRLVRDLMYPELEDAAKTLTRPDILGLQSNVIFIDHDHMESTDKRVSDSRDEGSKGSRQNLFEADMVLKIVRYLAQQGYGSGQQVVLTPYLGQLRLLMDRLKGEHDPILNDLDSADLVKAGLIPAASSNASKGRLRISTVDNFQGEESEIVIVSLTRGNKNGDIGFLSAPQRLNVLLSRARDGLIIIGNSTTFRSSRKGFPVWGPFLERLAKDGRIYDGLPTKCERHPDKQIVLKKPEEFDIECPDGGCNEPCPTTLNCGKHKCPQRCHSLVDHSKMKCMQIVETRCPLDHKKEWYCWQRSTPCPKCEAEARRLLKQQQQDYEFAVRRAERDRTLDAQRQERKDTYAKQLQEIDEEIAAQQRIHQDHLDQVSRDRTLEQRKKDLKQAQEQARKKMEVDKKAPEKPNSSNFSPKDLPQASGNGDKGTASPSSPSVDEPADIRVPSEAEAEWEYQKKFEAAKSEDIDTLMAMIGLESVKQSVLKIKEKVDASIRQGASLQSERFGAVLLGNPGTGKTTVARLYAKFLASVGVLPGTQVKEITAARLMSGGVAALEKLLDEVLKAGGGALFIDEAYQLVPSGQGAGSPILDYLLAEVENLTGKLVVILAGYDKQMEDFFAYNPGLPSRFPHEFRFQDYEDHELLGILQRQIEQRYEGRMKAEGGLGGLYCRIAARRVGYGRGRPGFGNARAVANSCAKIFSEQATRLKHQRRQGKAPDDLLLTKEDLIGPPPAVVLAKSRPWKKLNELTGLDTVKESVGALLHSVSQNYERELREVSRIEFNLNRVFLGSPGTGKTTVAKLYGEILANLGLLTKGEVVVKNPADFVGDVLGASEKNTKGILASTEGKVLVIDEAYGLFTNTGGGGQGGNDPFKTAVIDTLVAEVQSVPGEDRCVLLLGYKDQMEAMFQNVNPGLSRRFPLSEAFTFEDFTQDQLQTVLALKLKQQAYEATDEAVAVAMESLKRARNKPNFGNAGEIDILLNGAKARHLQRCARLKLLDNTTFEAADMDPDFNRAERSATNVRKLFEGVVGCDDLVRRLEGYQKTVSIMRSRDIDPRGHLPFNFLFSGPPGTGKTTTARKMGQIYFDMGFLATTEVIETSATDLIGQYIGQTGPKVQKLLEKARGKILFIDEAYRLAEGHFAKEAMDEIVDCLTKPDFAQRLVVILAGYDRDINRLMAINPGLTSRFPETIMFNHLDSQSGLQLLLKKLRDTPFLDPDKVDPPSNELQHEFTVRFDILKGIDNWANGRDVETIAKSISMRRTREADEDAKTLIPVDEHHIIDSLDEMITERRRRLYNAVQSPDSRQPTPPMPTAQSQDSEPPMRSSINIETAQKPAQQEEELSALDEMDTGDSEELRDADVSDEAWCQLQRDKEANTQKEENFQLLLKDQTKLEEEIAQDTTAGKKEKTEESGDDLEERRRRERERLERELRRRQKVEALEQLRKNAEEEQRRRQQEAQAQKKLRSLGVCVAGYRWIKQAGGYRCAGGSHFVSDDMLRSA